MTSFLQEHIRTSIDELITGLADFIDPGASRLLALAEQSKGIAFELDMVVAEVETLVEVSPAAREALSQSPLTMEGGKRRAELLHQAHELLLEAARVVPKPTLTNNNEGAS